MNGRTKSQNKAPNWSARRRATIALITILGSLAFFVLLGSGALQFALATAGCMKLPVSTSNFMASRSYVLPGDNGYGPGIFNEYKCSEQDAKQARYSRSVLTEASTAESEARRKKYEEEKRFSIDKVDFKVYTPTGIYTHGTMEVSAIGGGNQVFFSIKKDDYVIASAREGRAPNNYEVCTGAEDLCTDVGTAKDGQTIKKQVANRDIVTYGSRIGNTFINIEGAGELGVNEVTAIFSSLAEYKQ